MFNESFFMVIRRMAAIAVGVARLLSALIGVLQGGRAESDDDGSDTSV